MNPYDKAWGPIGASRDGVEQPPQVHEGLGDLFCDHDRVHAANYSINPPKKPWEDLWSAAEVLAVVLQLAVLGVGVVVLFSLFAGVAMAASPFAWVAVKVRNWLRPNTLRP